MWVLDKRTLQKQRRAMWDILRLDKHKQLQYAVRWPRVSKRAVLCCLQADRVLQSSGPTDIRLLLCVLSCNVRSLMTSWYCIQVAKFCLLPDTEYRARLGDKSFPKRHVRFARFRNFIHSLVTEGTADHIQRWQKSGSHKTEEEDCCFLGVTKFRLVQAQQHKISHSTNFTSL